MATVDQKIPASSDKPSQAEIDAKKLAEMEKKLFAHLQLDEQAALHKAQSLFQAAADARRRYDWEWLSRDLFRRGYQFTTWNAQTKTVTMTSTNNAKIPVNLTAASLRVIRNQITLFKPKWEVMPNSTDIDAIKEAHYKEKTLDYVYMINLLKKRIKETITQGLLFSVGACWQIVWDENIINDDGSKGFVGIWLIDPFDWYIDPNCTDGMAFTDAEYVIKAVRRPLPEVKNNPHYKNTEGLIRGDNRPAASEYKQFLLQTLKFLGQSSTSPDSDTVILKEGWFKERDDKGNVKIRIITWVDNIEKPLRNELTKYKDFPFRMYQADINPLEVYGEGWARHVIPINRVINTLESSMFDYNYKFAKGRLITDKNSGINIIDNQHGTIIEKNRGADIRSLQVAPLPASHETQIVRMRTYFEDVSGAHDVSLGRIPTGVKSGIGIAELKQADATNQNDLVDNLEDFLVEVAKKVLECLAENISFPRLVKATNIAGKADYFMIVGEKYMKGRRKKTAKVGEVEYPIVPIGPRNTVRVTIGSWLAYSKQQKQQELKDLFTAGVIDQRTLLEHMEFGDIDSIIERSRHDELLKIRRELQKVDQNKVTEQELATEENRMLLQGDSRVMAMPDDDHDVHIAVHSDYSTNQLVDLHIQQHMILKKAKKQAEGQVAEEAVPNTPAIEEAPLTEGLPPELANIPPEILQAGMESQMIEGQPVAQVPMAPAQQVAPVGGGVPAGGIPVGMG